jgi:hypothetical protein
MLLFWWPLTFMVMTSLVHRAAALLRASFRPRVAATPLRFANPSPPYGWIEDFHLQVSIMLGAQEKPRLSGAVFSFI